jgi:hypothetical protein
MNRQRSFDRQRSLRVAIAGALLASVASCAPADRSVRYAWGPTQIDDETACRAGHADACGALGAWLVANNRRPAEVERGLVLLEAACGLDDLPSCATLGGLYARTRASETAHDRGVDLLARACEGGLVSACAPAPSPPAPRQGADGPISL